MKDLRDLKDLTIHDVKPRSNVLLQFVPRIGHFWRPARKLHLKLTFGQSFGGNLDATYRDVALLLDLKYRPSKVCTTNRPLLETRQESSPEIDFWPKLSGKCRRELPRRRSPPRPQVTSF